MHVKPFYILFAFSNVISFLAVSSLIVKSVTIRKTPGIVTGTTLDPIACSVNVSYTCERDMKIIEQSYIYKFITYHDAYDYFESLKDKREISVYYLLDFSPLTSLTRLDYITVEMIILLCMTSFTIVAILILMGLYIYERYRIRNGRNGRNGDNHVIASI